MAAPKSPRALGMAATPSSQDIAALQYDPPAVPQDPAALAAAVLQLQNTVNSLIAYILTHTHSGVTTGASNSGAPTSAFTGTAQSAQNLFTAN